MRNMANAGDGTTSIVYEESEADLPPIPEGLVLFLFGEEETQDGDLPIPPDFINDDQTDAVWYVDRLATDLRNYGQGRPPEITAWLTIEPARLDPWLEWCRAAAGKILILHANTSSGPGPAGRSGHITN